MVYTYNGILFSLVKRSSVICETMGEARGYYAKWNKPVTGQILYNFTYKRYIK